MIIFSEVTLVSESGKTTDGLIIGIPNALSDLDGWMFAESFLESLPEKDFVTCKVRSFGYGEGEALRATVEEVAYIYMRLQMRPDFLETRCESLGSHRFTFDWVRE